jgi:hypothetical protein
MWVREQRFPISDGLIVAALRSGLAGTWGSTGTLTVGTKVPATKTRRMVTVRDDSGLAVGRTQPRRQGINVWADSSVDALNLALDAMEICQADLPIGDVIAAVDGFTGPFEIDEDVPYTVIVSSVTKSLTNYYFTFIATVKAAAAA